jgi:hypothetical protein
MFGSETAMNVTDFHEAAMQVLNHSCPLVQFVAGSPIPFHRLEMMMMHCRVDS